ncbi:MAG: hypothetical protein V7631_1846 [Massilia sp.]|jgi:hypothetical protein
METTTTLPDSAQAFGISFDGRAYHYGQYSYDRFADALGYAKLDRARPGFHEEARPHDWPQWAGPTQQELTQMAAHDIAYSGGRYCYGPYRYDLLVRALEYAGREPGLLPNGGTKEREQ